MKKRLLIAAFLYIAPSLAMAAGGDYAHLGARGAMVEPIFGRDAAMFKPVSPRWRAALSGSKVFKDLAANEVGLAGVVAQLEAAHQTPESYENFRGDRVRFDRDQRNKASAVVETWIKGFSNTIRDAEADQENLEEAVAGLGLIVDNLQDYIEPSKKIAEVKKTVALGEAIRQSHGVMGQAKAESASLLARPGGEAAQALELARKLNGTYGSYDAKNVMLEMSDFLARQNPGQGARVVIAKAIGTELEKSQANAKTGLGVLESAGGEKPSPRVAMATIRAAAKILADSDEAKDNILAQAVALIARVAKHTGDRRTIKAAISILSRPNPLSPWSYLAYGAALKDAQDVLAMALRWPKQAPIIHDPYPIVVDRSNPDRPALVGVLALVSGLATIRDFPTLGALLVAIGVVVLWFIVDVGRSADT